MTIVTLKTKEFMIKNGLFKEEDFEDCSKRYDDPKYKDKFYLNKSLNSKISNDYEVTAHCDKCGEIVEKCEICGWKPNEDGDSSDTEILCFNGHHICDGCLDDFAEIKEGDEVNE